MSETVRDLFGLNDRNVNERLVGVELECEFARGQQVTAPRRWNTTPDGSLRGNGVEFVSRPLSVDAVCNDMIAMYNNMPIGRAGSPRTSMHVHVNAKFMTLEQVRAVAAMYALVEPAAFLKAGVDRELCVYCVPWWTTPSYADALSPRRRGRTVFSAVTSSPRYSALNLRSLSSWGTLEFRGAPLWAMAGDACDWTRWCANLVYGAAEECISPPDLLERVATEGYARVVRPYLPRGISADAATAKAQSVHSLASLVQQCSAYPSERPPPPFGEHAYDEGIDAVRPLRVAPSPLGSFSNTVSANTLEFFENANQTVRVRQPNYSTNSEYLAALRRVVERQQEGQLYRSQWVRADGPVMPEPPRYDQEYDVQIRPVEE